MAALRGAGRDGRPSNRLAWGRDEGARLPSPIAGPGGAAVGRDDARASRGTPTASRAAPDLHVGGGPDALRRARHRRRDRAARRRRGGSPDRRARPALTRPSTRRTILAARAGHCRSSTRSRCRPTRARLRAAGQLRLRARALGARARRTRGGDRPVGERGLRNAQSRRWGQAPALSQQLSDRRRQRRAREGSESPHLSRFRPRLAYRLLGWHRRQDSARQPRMGQDAGRARGAEGRGARLDRIPQRALHRDRGPEPARRHRRKRAAITRIACARWPVLSSERPNGESANEPHKRKRPAHKVPGVDL